MCSGSHTYQRNREHLRASRESPDPEISIPDVPADVDVNEGDAARSEPICQTAQPRSGDFRPDVREDLPAAITAGQTSKHPGWPQNNPAEKV